MCLFLTALGLHCCTVLSLVAESGGYSPIVVCSLLNAVAAAGAKVTGSADKTRGAYAAAIIDTDIPVTADAFNGINGILKVRTI